MKKQIIITLLLNSQQKSLKTKFNFWIRLCTKTTETFHNTSHLATHEFLKEKFKKRLKEFQKHLRERERGYPHNLINLTLSLKYTSTKIFKRKNHWDLCYALSTISPTLKSMHHETLANDREPTSSKTDLQRTSNYIAQTRKASKGYTRKS